MKATYQNTLVPNCPNAVTVNYQDESGSSVLLFNAKIEITPPGAQGGAYSATVTKVDGVGAAVSDATGALSGTATGATPDDAIVAAALAMSDRVMPKAVAPTPGPSAPPPSAP